MSRKWFPGLTPSRPAPVDLDTGAPQPRPSPLEAGGYVAVARKD